MVPVRVAYKLGRCSFALLPPPPSSAIPIPHPSLTFGLLLHSWCPTLRSLYPPPRQDVRRQVHLDGQGGLPAVRHHRRRLPAVAFQLARSVAVNPDVSVMKSTRAQCIPEDWDAEKNGSAFHEHA
eukprot:jgi/Tetstr1/438957/TSEL_027451.t1